MNKLFLLLTVTVGLLVPTARANDCRVATTTMGDWNLVSLGGYTLAKPVLVNLAPTNAPIDLINCRLRCQVVYVNASLPHPDTEAEYALARATGVLLNDWLEQLVRAEYAQADFSELMVAYRNSSVAEDLNAKFPEVVKSRLLELAPESRPDIEAVTVSVEAEGAFRELILGEIARDDEVKATAERGEE